MTFAVSKVDDLTQEVDYLVGLFGQVLTAFIAGVNDARIVEAWAGGMPVDPPDRRRNLRAAYEVARMLRASFSEQTVQAWFMGMNPHLDDHSPAEVVKTDPELVLRAADDFLANG